MPFLLTALILAAACVIGYLPTLTVGFLCDDFVFLNAMKHVSLLNIAGGGVYFRPFVILISALEWLISGEKPFVFHLVNLIWHWTGAIGVACLASALIRKPYAALIAGLVFALHPAHPEAVTWLSGRFDVICGTLLIWSFYFYILASEAVPGKSRSLFRASFITFALACLSKEQAFVFPLTILLYEFLLTGDSNKPASSVSIKIKRAIPFFIIAGCVFFVRWMILGGMGGYVPDDTQRDLYMTYLRNIALWPFVVLFVPTNRSLLETSGLWLAALTVIILLSPLLLLFRLQARILVFCAIAVALNMIPSGHLGVAIGSLQNSRFLYTPSVFFAILIAGIFASSFQTTEPRIFSELNEKGTGNFSHDELELRCKSGAKRCLSPSPKIKSAAIIVLIVYLLTFTFWLQQNNYPWIIAGKMVRAATQSTEVLYMRHKSQWGSGIHKLLLFDVPNDYIGAWTFKTGLVEMLRDRYGAEMEEVDIEVMSSGLQTQENIEKPDQAYREGAIVWIFNPGTETFYEYKWE